MTERNEDIKMAELEEIRKSIPAATAYMDELLATKGPEFLSTVISMVIIRQKLNELHEKDPDRATLLTIVVGAQVLALLNEQGIPVKEITEVSDKLYGLGLEDLCKTSEATTTSDKE